MLNKKYVPENFLKLGIYTILILVPFHAFFTAWFASNFGYFDAIRLWKEVLLILILPALIFTLYKNKKILKNFSENKLVKVSLAYIIFQLFMTLYGYISGNVSFQASVYGLIINTRFLVFMMVCMVFSQYPKRYVDYRKFILIPGCIVIAFGSMQLFLPADFLKHFGYGPETLITHQTVDNKSEVVRLQSTLRGPNPLGAYLVVIGLMLVAMLKSTKVRLLAVAPLFVVLFHTYSRSAWIGLVLSSFTYLYMVAGHKNRKIFISALSIVICLSVSFIYVFRDNDFIQNTVFHTNEKSTSSISSNEARLNSINGSVETIIDEPLGFGVGSAGPASFRNDNIPPNITENYFLQIGVESGVFGLLLFCLLIIIIAKELIDSQTYESTMILSLLVGLVIINMISHAWADDTLAYIFFGLVGLTLGSKNSTKSENLVV